MRLKQELKNVLSSALEDTNTQEPLVDPKIDIWDTRKAWEQEFNLYPKVSREEVYSRLYDQVVDMLRIMQERVSQQTWNERDKELIDGLNNISVMHVRLGRFIEKVLKQAKKPNM